tara:strand:+ start:502 stop:792 length:291 start_codon:yes stop_codon:yes gene_type:complete
MVLITDNLHKLPLKPGELKFQKPIKAYEIVHSKRYWQFLVVLENKSTNKRTVALRKYERYESEGEDNPWKRRANFTINSNKNLEKIVEALMGIKLK